MPVQIDMDMPKSCFICPLHFCFKDMLICTALQKNIAGKCSLMHRYEKCPLREVKE